MAIPRDDAWSDRGSLLVCCGSHDAQAQVVIASSTESASPVERETSHMTVRRAASASAESKLFSCMKCKVARFGVGWLGRLESHFSLGERQNV